VSLAARAAVKATGARIAILDIERMKGSASVEFWDLGEFKNRRIHPADVIEWPRNICSAWRWYGETRTHFAAEWEPEGREGLARAMWDVYDSADIVVGHNIAGFDTKKLKNDWLEMGLRQPSTWRTVDTLKVARREFGMESNTLDALCKRLGIASKTDRYDVEVARRALAGHKPSQQRLKRYNCGDIDATEALYETLRGWDPTHPHLGLYSGQERSCYACGSGELVAMTNDTKTARTGYAAFRCSDCGAISRNNHRRTIVTMVPAR
jgi:hypothetical protein